MNVLALFDGISCGQIALERAGIKVDNYFSCEIDNFARQIIKKNYPNTIEVGDIKDFEQWIGSLPKIDLLTAGFPCQAWSVAGKMKGDNDPRGSLVHDLISVWNYLKDKNSNLKFLFENVKMKKVFLNYINKLFGVEPILINSALVSAQNRERYYWTNIEGVTQPKDKGILVRDIIVQTYDNMVHPARLVNQRVDDNFHRKDGNKDYEVSRILVSKENGKSDCITAGGGHAYLTSLPNGKYFKEGKVFGYNKDVKRVEYENTGKKEVPTTFSRMKSRMKTNEREKAHTICASDHKGINGNQGRNAVYNGSQYRAFLPIEYERLQTIPDNYTEGLSRSQRYKTTGNGWTVDVIAHILSFMKP